MISEDGLACVGAVSVAMIARTGAHSRRRIVIFAPVTVKFCYIISEAAGIVNFAFDESSCLLEDKTEN